MKKTMLGLRSNILRKLVSGNHLNQSCPPLHPIEGLYRPFRYLHRHLKNPRLHRPGNEAQVEVVKFLTPMPRKINSRSRRGRARQRETCHPFHLFLEGHYHQHQLHNLDLNDLPQCVSLHLLLQLSQTQQNRRRPDQDENSLTPL